ncbi:hypothetical protein ACOBMW_07860 [Weissella cibaria]|nr:hypothetical protein [Weissella cibaria]
MTLYEILHDAETRSAGITNLAAFILKETDDEANQLRSSNYDLRAKRAE